MIKLVAFDWNGTLIADIAPTLRAVNSTLKTFGFKPISLLRYRQTFDIPVAQAYENVGIDKKWVIKNSKKISKAFLSYYEPNVKQVRTRKNLKKLLAWLGNHKTEQIIFSNHQQDKIKHQLERLRLSKHFTQILANSRQHKAYTSRNKEAWLKDFVRKKELKGNEVLVVGDTAEEIDIGKKIDAVTVAITGGNFTTSRLKAAKPDFLINNLGELISIIKQINKN